MYLAVFPHKVASCTKIWLLNVPELKLFWSSRQSSGWESKCSFCVCGGGVLILWSPRAGWEERLARDAGIRHQSSADTYCSREDTASSTISDHGLGIFTIISSGNAASSQADVQIHW